MSTEIKVSQDNIKTHGSVSCAQEASVPHPWVINSKNNNAIFMYTLFRDTLTNQMIFVMEMPANISTSHSEFQLNRTKHFWDMNLQKLA